MAFDIVFAEPDRTSPRRLLGEIGENMDQSLAALVEQLSDHDFVFAEAIKGANVVTAFALTDRGGGGLLPPIKFGIATAGADPKSYLSTFSDAVTSLPPIEEASTGAGMINIIPDTDGVVRRVPLLAALGDQVYPSLALETLRVVQGASFYIVKSVGASMEEGFGEKTGITQVRVGAFTVPTDA